MKITNIDIIQFNLISDENTNFQPIGCRIYTDSGLYGDGEAAIAFGMGSEGAIGVLKRFSKEIIGENPCNIEYIWEKLYRSSFWLQNGGPINFSALSAIDMALWDIKGKFYEAPVYELLGGKIHDSLDTYASQLQFGWGNNRTSINEDSQYIECALNAVSQGYKTIKIDFLTINPLNNSKYIWIDTNGIRNRDKVKIVERRVRKVREAIGNDIDIIIEGHGFTDAELAINIAKAIESYNILYFEEPVTPTPRLNKYVYDNINIPIAQGERIYSRWEFIEFFIDHSVQLIQPDIGTSGGFTEVKKICDMAHTFDIGVQLHVCGTPLSTAAAIQLESVIPNFTIHEHHVNNLHKYNKELCIYDYQPINGKFFVPQIPGIGNEYSKEALSRANILKVS